MPVRVRFAAPVAAAVALTAFASCGGSPERSASRFCSELDRQLPALQTTPAAAEDFETLLAAYEEVGEVAPLAVEEDWQRLTELVRAAMTAAIDDPESMQELAEQSYATERPYVRIAEWVSSNCGLTMPAAGGIETTTVAPPPTDSTPAS